MKTKRSATLVNRDGVIRIKLFPRTPLVIFTDLKWDTASITGVRINGVLHSLVKDQHDRTKFRFARAGKVDNTITLAHYTLTTPEQDATKELVIKIETGGSVKEMQINDIYVVQEASGAGGQIYKADVSP